MPIIIKNQREQEIMRKGGKILGTVLSELEKMIKPGITTIDLDRYAEKRIRELGGLPAFKGYQKFPCTLCTNINQEVVHTIPSRRALQTGDIISIDCGVIYQGLYTDSAITVAVGKIPPAVAKFIKTAYSALEKAVKIAKNGSTTYQISGAIEDEVTKNGYGIVKTLTGHGVGKNLHEDPYILNYRDKHHNAPLQAGMTIAIEPIITMGRSDIITLADGWTTETKDRSLAVQVEHTILITEKGAEILTKRPK
jgi:methionyl aminopeptidase